MTDIQHEIKIDASPQAIYQALTDASAISRWHTAQTQSTNGDHDSFTTAPQDGPHFEWKVLKPDAQTVEWLCLAGPGHAPGTRARFKLSPLSDGRTLVEFSHSGWSETDGTLRKCNTLWAILLFHLQKHLETKQAGPAF